MVRTFIILVAMAAAVCAHGQSRFCRTYQDFCNDQWERADSVCITLHSKGYQFWWGGNDYKLSCKDKDIDNALKKEAFAVALDDSLYVNCRNLRYQKCAFGRGYVRAKRIGSRSLLLVNRLTGKDVVNKQVGTGILFGAIGAAAVASENMKQQVCYVISKGADEKGKIEVRLLNDKLMSLMLKDHGPLLAEYYLEDDDNLRILASRVIPILEKAGLIKP